MCQAGLDRVLRIIDLLLAVASLVALVGWVLGLVPVEVLPLTYVPLLGVTVLIRRRGRRSEDPPPDG